MLFLLAAFSGAFTIFSPCILPVIPFVFSRTGTPFRQGTLPLLCGMAVMFAAVATLASVAGAWAVQLNSAGRFLAIAGVGVLGISLVWPPLAQWITAPLVRLGARLDESASREQAASADSFGAAHLASTPRRAAALSFVLGMATGLLWAPCAGPVLGLVLAGAIWQGPNAHTSLLLLAYACGAGLSLALVARSGSALMARLRPSVAWASGMRKGLGVCVLAGVTALTLGFDAAALSPWSSRTVDALEQQWLRQLAPASAPSGLSERSEESESPAPLRVGKAVSLAAATLTRVALSSPASSSVMPTAQALPVLRKAPPIQGAVQWLNSPPLTPEQLQGKVVLVNFWTFGCYNCKNALPYVRDWYRKYKDQGLVVIGVHSPEFAFEKDIGNVKKALVDLDVPFPVAIDNNFAIWKSFNNHYWPANYFIDAKGNLRFVHFGEGEYDRSEAVIQQLLAEAKASGV